MPRYHESHNVTIDENLKCSLFLSIVLARSTQMLFFSAGQRGKITKKSYAIMAKISCIRIFEHPALGKHSIKLKEIYDILAEYYEFGGRFNVMQSKIKDLRKIVGIETRLLLFEIFLLSLFSFI